MLSRGVNEMVRSAEALGRETTFIPLTRTVWTQPRTISPVLWHAIDYAALEKHDVDLMNYEPRTGYFPTKIRPGVHLARITDVGYGAMNADVAPYLSQAEYVFTWQFMAWAPVFGRLEGKYDLVNGVGGTRVYRRRRY